jgi:nifR3 family TIM-barrel protein
MTQPELLYRLVEAIKNAVAVPVTVKFRLGWDGSSINVVEIAKRAVEAGVDAITLHARTAVQGYAGRSDWAWIQRLKASVGVPVIGNGDVTHPELVHRMLKDTGCDAVMIGRGSLGNPWIFGVGQTTSEHTGKAGGYLDWADFSTALQVHLEGILEDRPNRSAGALRKVIGWYLHGCPGAARLRQQLMELSSWQEMFELCRSAVTGWEARGLSLASVILGSPIEHEAHEPSGTGCGRICRGKQLSKSPADALAC